MSPSAASDHPLWEEPAVLAHTLWEFRGCPSGLEAEIWQQAQEQLSEQLRFPLGGVHEFTSRA